MDELPSSLYDDPDHPEGGFTALRLEGLGHGSSSDPAFFIERASRETAYLGPEGWQSGEYLWHPIRVERQGDALVLVMGPEIALLMEHDEYAVIRVGLPGLGACTTVIWTGLTPPQPTLQDDNAFAGQARFALDGEGRIILNGTTEADGSAQPYTEEFSPGDPILGLPYARLKNAYAGDLVFDPVRRVARIIREEGPPRETVHKSTPPPASETDGAVNGTGHDPEHPGTNDLPPPGKRPWLPLLISAVVFLAAVGTGVGYWVSTQDSTPVTDPVQPPRPAVPCSLAQLSACSDDALFDNGQAAVQAGRWDDARTWFSPLISRGHGPTLLVFAQAADSLDFSTGLFLRPDDQIALAYYEQACSARHTPAFDAFDAYKRYLEEQAAMDSEMADLVQFDVPRVADVCGG